MPQPPVIRFPLRSLDDRPRWVVPTDRIPSIADQLETGDILAFATAIEGLDVSWVSAPLRTR